MADFADIPIRINDKNIDADWFNTIRQALIDSFGAVFGEQTQNINDVDSGVAVVERAFDSNDYRVIIIDFHSYRRNDSEEKAMSGRLVFHYKPDLNDWEMSEGDLFGDDAKTTFSFTQDKTGGTNSVFTLRYSTTTIGGTGHAGILRTKANTFVR